ncbi:hypothetical protein Deipe_0788 [Deinococcus peraridilitoris DSM 19664]|uniref:Uncharacterized protein n=2 Tax=Deinococcus TaxID=1298 RepID=K9ZXH2_DEIPD|nr:hypothetical protein Deipe_0788 [Deinococcus peraridilitoris DSM 19664]
MVLGCTSGAVSVVGTAPPWLRELGGLETHYRQTSAPDALRELYAGRADVALVSRPGPLPPRGIGPVVFLPVAVYPVRLAYRLPGVDLQLDLKTACRIFAGRVLTWDHREIAALNPEVRLPSLPILTTARSVPNAASQVFAEACVTGGWWPSTWRKSSWSAGAVNIRTRQREQLADLRVTGSLGLLGPLEQAPDLQVARLRSPGGLFVEASVAQGVDAVPASVYTSLAPVKDAQAYPLRGLVWAVYLREQRYRERGLQEAQALHAFLTALQAQDSEFFTPLPEQERPSVRLTFGGRDLATFKGPPAPRP